MRTPQCSSHDNDVMVSAITLTHRPSASSASRALWRQTAPRLCASAGPWCDMPHPSPAHTPFPALSYNIAVFCLHSLSLPPSLPQVLEDLLHHCVDDHDFKVLAHPALLADTDTSAGRQALLPLHELRECHPPTPPPQNLTYSASHPPPSPPPPPPTSARLFCRSFVLHGIPVIIQQVLSHQSISKINNLQHRHTTFAFITQHHLFFENKYKAMPFIR